MAVRTDLNSVDPLAQLTPQQAPKALGHVAQDRTLQGRVAVVGAQDFSVPANAPYAADNTTRYAVCDTLKAGAQGADFYYLDGGDVRFKPRPMLDGSQRSLEPWTSDFGECGDASCGCYRLKRPAVRSRFIDMVVASTACHLRATGAGVRYVTVGSGRLLTDFEILCRLWSLGFQIEAILAVDTAYSDGTESSCIATGGVCANLHHSNSTHSCSRSLSQLAAFFAPAHVLAFGSLAALSHACVRQPDDVGSATIFVRCDAAAVDDSQTLRAANALLAPGCFTFVLDNIGKAHGGYRTQLEAELPPHLHAPSTSASLRCWRKVAAPSTAFGHACPALQTSSAADGGVGCIGAKTFDSTVFLQEVPVEGLGGLETQAAMYQRISEAAQLLQASQLERAARKGRRVFRIVYNGKVPVRDQPSREGSIVGARASGQVVLVDGVADGWAKLSMDDAYWGYEQQARGTASAAGYMLLHGKQVGQPGLGELLHELAFDGVGGDIDADDWMPRVF